MRPLFKMEMISGAATVQSLFFSFLYLLPLPFRLAWLTGSSRTQYAVFYPVFILSLVRVDGGKMVVFLFSYMFTVSFFFGLPFVFSLPASSLSLVRRKSSCLVKVGVMKRSKYASYFRSLEHLFVFFSLRNSVALNSLIYPLYHFLGNALLC